MAASRRLLALAVPAAGLPFATSRAVQSPFVRVHVVTEVDREAHAVATRTSGVTMSTTPFDCEVRVVVRIEPDGAHSNPQAQDR